VSYCHHQLFWPGSAYSRFDGIFLPRPTSNRSKYQRLTFFTQANLEDLVLSGKLFNGGGSGASSPRRSPSPDAAKWPDDKDADSYSDGDGSPRRLPSAAQSNSPGTRDNGGVGVGVQGRTGVKGVIRDRNEAERGARDKRAAEIKELNKKMEKASLTGRTYLEEKALEDEGVEELEEMRFARARDKGRTSHGGGGRFGHLREVGLEGFLKAVEAEERHVWVVLHLYHPVRLGDTWCLTLLKPWLQSLDRCEALDNTLGKLAREHGTVKFLRAKASAVGFASGSSTTQKRTTLSASTRYSIKSGTIREEDEEDPYGEPEYNEKDHEEEDDEFDDEDNVDTDMLPTLLVYRGGDLIYNWVRVDWEAGKAGVEELLIK